AFGNLAFYGGVSVTGGSGVALNDDSITAQGVTLSGGSGPHLEHNIFSGAGLTLTGGVSGASVRYNLIGGAGQGIAVTGAGATGFEIRSNQLRGNATGIALTVAAAGHISGNDVSGGGTALDL